MIFYFRSIFPQLLLNAFIVYRIWKNNDIHIVLKWILSFIYGVELIIYLIGLFFPFHLSVDTYTIIQKINGVWVISQIYLAALILLFDLTFYINKRWHIFHKYKESIVNRIKIISFGCLFVFICIQLYFGYNNFLHPEVKTYQFSFNKLVNEQRKPIYSYKMLVVSDLHLGYIIDKEILKMYVDSINAQHADFVIINGDLIDFSLRPLLEKNMKEELSKITAPKGVFFIPGNHEYKFNADNKFSWITDCGITILKDSIASIDNNLFLIGRDDRSQKEKRLPMDELIQKVDLTKPCVLFAHQPGDIPDAYKYHVPLTICGHTHRGQVFPVNIAGYFLYTNSYGMQTKDSCVSYTTSGLGLSGFPLRISSHSEIVIFNIDIYSK